MANDNIATINAIETEKIATLRITRLFGMPQAAMTVSSLSEFILPSANSTARKAPIGSSKDNAPREL